MANTKISIDSLSETVMKELNEYADVACDEMKDAVKSSSKLVKDQIKATAPSLREPTPKAGRPRIQGKPPGLWR